MSENPSLPPNGMFWLRSARLDLTVAWLHFGLRLGSSPTNMPFSAREPWFWDML